MSDRAGELGAFVTTIFRGGAADQLHGELRAGTQYSILISISYVDLYP